MKLLTRGGFVLLGVSLVAGASFAVAPAQAANKPTPLQIATGYMKMPLKIPQKIPLKVKPTPGGKVAFIQQGASVTLEMGSGVKQGAEAVGWEYVDVPYDPTNPSTFTRAVQNALALGATAIVDFGFNPDLISQSVKDQAAAAHVPIHVVSVCPFQPKGVLFIGAGGCVAEYQQAKALASWFVADSKGAGHILLESNTTFPIYEFYKDQFIANVKAMCSACKVDVLEITQGQATSNQVPSAVVARLRQDPSIHYVFFDSATNSRGVVPALDAAGLLATTKIGGRSIDATALGYLKAGQNVVWTATPYTTLGIETMDSVLRVATKSSGITLNGAVPMQLITTVNVNSLALPFVAPVNALAQYKKLWHVG